MIYGSLLFRVKMNDVMSIQFQFFHEPFQNRQCVFSSKLPVHDWQNIVVQLSRHKFNLFIMNRYM